MWFCTLTAAPAQVRIAPMLRLTEIRLPLDHPQDALSAAICKRLGIGADELVSYSIFRRGHDARKPSAIVFTYTLDVAVKDEAAKSVKGTINAHKTIWEDKSPEDRKELTKLAETVSLRVYGHRVNCPACESAALLHGSPAGAESSTYKDGFIVVRQPSQ